MAMKTAFIIDDNQSNLNVLQMMLGKNGVNAIGIPSPHQLDKALGQHSSFDVIFLDLEFPNYSGYELVGQLKARGDLEDTPIIAYSVQNSEIREIQAAGFDGFLGKPLQPINLPTSWRASFATNRFGSSDSLRRTDPVLPHTGQSAIVMG